MLPVYQVNTWYRHSIVTALKMLLLLSCWIITGIMAEDPPMMHYKLKNSTVCLHVRKPPPYKDVRWGLSGKFIISGTEINPKYAQRVDYNPGNLSLCINELMDTDAGIYDVSFRDSNFNSIKESHKVVVQEMVPRPVMKMSVLQSNLSAGFCSITVNCSVQDDWLWSVCDEDSCRTSQKSVSKVNITVVTHNRTVVCSGNNHVSTANASESIATTCFSESDPKPKEVPQQVPKTLIISVVWVFLCGCAVFLAKKHLSTACNRHQTYTDQLIQNQPVETQPQSEPRVSTSSSSHVEPSYENVDVSQAGRPREELGSEESQKVDTIYSVPRPTCTASLGNSDSSKDAKGHKDIQEASTLESVMLHEAQNPTQVDTVYSVLQRPKI